MNMMIAVLFLVALLSFDNIRGEKLIKGPSEFGHRQSSDTSVEGKQWAVLVAGSNEFFNYRHQADVCHAYQILRKGGLKDENIIVFMYDDIAFNEYNPRPGIIINKPYGEDVYNGVPKDYTGENCTAHNLLAVILGNKTALTGGSGKVVESGPLDQIFIYYADHGSPGLVGMPSGDVLYANDLINALKQKHASNSYKRIVFYLEACESGSMFEGILPDNLRIYAVTASNATESSYATYCPGEIPGPPSEFETCLGDLFSISWMEDSDLHDLTKETLLKQYQAVRRRTAVDTEEGSHVMQYGDMELVENPVFLYLGNNPQNGNHSSTTPYSSDSSLPFFKVVDQRDASLIPYWYKYHRAAEGSKEKAEAKKELSAVLSHRRHVDKSINQIATILFGQKKSPEFVKLKRPSGQPLVDDWDCLKTYVKTYEKHCGVLSWYGKKYTRAIANMCNAGVTLDQMNKASIQACSTING